MPLPRFPLGASGVEIPPIVFGTSCLGNLYQAVSYETKRSIVEEFFKHVDAPVVLDSAGKYGAGLALEVIGRALRELRIPPSDVMISNKLGWKRIPLKGPEPTFEPGAWADLEHDAEQCIDGEGIIEAWNQGNELLGEGYTARVVSVHDPDEYLAAAADEAERTERFERIIEAYQALKELRERGEVDAIGVGSKDWRVIRRIVERVRLDWVMLAVNLTVYTHPPELLEFVERLRRENIAVINSAVFHAGFLVGGKFFDYRVPDPDSPEDKGLFEWRERFHDLCRRREILPAAACVQYALRPEGVIAIALNTSSPKRVKQNVDLVQTQICDRFWEAMKDEGLL